MDMAMDTSSSPSSPMKMVFTTAHTTPLFSSHWTPSSASSYAGTCIFLIALAIIARALVALKALLEHRWSELHLHRRYIAANPKAAEDGCSYSSASSDSDTGAAPPTKPATFIAPRRFQEEEEEQSVKLGRSRAGAVREPLPWRFGTEVPRAFLFLLITGVSYLLMLAVMTMNVGYFCSVLAGSFLGEMAVGRYVHWNAHGH